MLDAMFSRLWNSGTACVALAAFIFSALAVLVKLGSASVPVLQFVCVPSFLSAAVLAATLACSPPKPPPPPVNAGQTHHRPPATLLLLVRGLLGAVVVSCCFGSIELLPLEDAITLFFCNPVFVVVLEAALNRAPAGLNGLMGCLLTMAGVVLISEPPLLFAGGPSGPQAARQKLGVALGLTAAAANAASFLVVRALSDLATTPQITLWYHVVVCLATAVPLGLGWPRPAVLWPTAGQLATIGGVFCCTFTGQLLLNRGLQLESATRGSAVNVTQVLYSYVWNLTLFKEPFSLTGLLGSLSIVLGVVAVGGQDCYLSGRQGGRGKDASGKRGAEAGRKGGAEEDEEGGEEVQQQQPLLLGQRTSSDEELGAAGGGVGLGARRGRTAGSGDGSEGALVGVEVRE